MLTLVLITQLSASTIDVCEASTVMIALGCMTRRKLDETHDALDPAPCQNSTTTTYTCRRPDGSTYIWDKK